MLGGTNRRGVAAPLDMVIFESNEYTLPGWDMLSAYKDRLWTLKQYKKYIIGPHIVRLWYCDDMDTIRGWVAHWEFCITACAIPQFALWYTKVIRFTRGGQNLPTCTYSNFSMVYAKVMLGKRVNWSTMTTHSCFDIIADTIDIPIDVN
jgi:hypothetical protein